ncbi:MAG: hypothetical protein ABIJ15_00705 [bacterium]
MTKVLNEIKILLKSLVFLILLLNVVLIIQLLKNADVSEVHAKYYEEPTRVDIVKVGGSPVYSFNGIPVNIKQTKN